MKQLVLLKELQAGMVLGQDVTSTDGRSVMTAGTVLNDFLIELLSDPASLGEILPQGMTADEFTLIVDIPDPDENLRASDALSVPSAAEPPRARKEKDALLDPVYVETYNAVLKELRKLLDRRLVDKGIDIDAIGLLIADRQLDKLCDGARAVTQMHNMDRDGDYLLHHSLHVSILAGLMGRWLHLGREKKGRLILAGLLHDVGKLRIPEQILNKPGKLTDEEMEIMRCHPMYSVELLTKSGLGAEEDIMMGIMQHHERCDGSGYPSGIRKGNILSFGRILAILDIYDAMTANRAFAHRHSPFEIFDILTADMMAGKLDAEFGVLFVKKICNDLTGSWVLLSNGERAKIIYIDQSRTSSLPIVETESGKFYDLAHDSRIKISEMLTYREAVED